MQPIETPPDPLLGTLVAERYRILKPLGEGGMGQVYLAEHEAIEKKVAVKVLRREYSEKPDIVARFQQEAVSASRIKHPNVLDVFDFGQLDNGCFFLAMEFLEGNDLADELTRHRLLDPQRGVRIALQICRALAAAHSRGVVHRDMKPENVFLQHIGDGEEIVKIVDFGIAQLRSTEEAAASEPKRRRLTRTGMIFGTPEYMAPEQAAGKTADLRVDVYATGIILYEMFTGAVPFTGETFMAVLAAHLNNPTPPMTSVCPDLQVSIEMQHVIVRALLKNPDERFQSMGELAAAILATPEGATVGRHGSIPDAPAQQFISAGNAMDPAPAATGTPTSAQFGAGGVAPAHAGTAAQFPGASPGLDAPESKPLPPQSRTGSVPAQTRLDASGSVPGVPTRRSRTGLFLALLVLGGGGIAAALLFLRSRVVPTPPPILADSAPVAASIPAPPASAAPAASTAAVPAPSASASPAATAIHLHVQSTPAGAVVKKNGFQVCDKTPCEVDAHPDETLELEASKGVLHGKAKVLAQRDQTVEIKLVAPAAPHPHPPKAPKMCEVMVDGLKILRPCK